jgi:uncharacterized damage-inducible protein DinB
MAKIKDILLSAYEEAFNGKAWHGPSLYGTLKKLKLDQIGHKKTTDGYTVWQVVLHCAYWKWYVRKQLSDKEIEKFPRSPRDWPAVPAKGDAAAWKDDLDLLVQEHARLLALIARSNDRKLQTLIGGKTPAARLIYGVTAHDVYHTAQIRNMGVPGMNKK